LPRLSGAAYLQFLTETLLGLLADLPKEMRQNMLYQHDRAPTHFTRTVREALDNMFPDRWIGRNGPVAIIERELLRRLMRCANLPVLFKEPLITSSEEQI